MHASAAAGGVERKRSSILKGFVEVDAMPRLNRFHTSRSDPFGLFRAAALGNSLMDAICFRFQSRWSLDVALQKSRMSPGPYRYKRSVAVDL